MDPKLYRTVAPLPHCQAQARLSKRVDAHIFLHPVDPVRDQCPDYLSIIANPMDIGTVAARLAAGEYSSASGLGGHVWFADVKMTFDNAMTYNPVAHPVHRQARKLSDAFADAYVAILSKAEGRLRRFGSSEVPAPSSRNPITPHALDPSLSSCHTFAHSASCHTESRVILFGKDFLTS